MSSIYNAAAAPQPSVVQITLPPGFTLQQFYTLQGTTVSVAIGEAVPVALVIWDFFALLPDELALYRDSEKRLWKIPGPWAFLVLRYSSLMAMLPALWFTSLQNKHCQLTASMSQAGVVLVTASAGLIFCFRVFSLWHGNKFVYGAVGTLYLCMVGCYVATATQLYLTQGPPTNFGSNCVVQGVPSWSPLSFSSSVAFDTVVLILTISKLKGANLSGVSGQIFRDNLLYFTLVTITNIGVLTIQSLGSNDTAVKPVSLPYPTLMTSAMGSRVFLNLRLYNTRRQFDALDIPISSDTLRNRSGRSRQTPLKFNRPSQSTTGAVDSEASYPHIDSDRKTHELPLAQPPSPS